MLHYPNNKSVKERHFFKVCNAIINLGLIYSAHNDYGKSKLYVKFDFMICRL